MPADDFVRTDWDNFRALDHLERLGLAQLPVLGPDRSIAGIVDRSRLTTRMLLEIAAQAN